VPIVPGLEGSNPALGQMCVPESLTVAPFNTQNIDSGKEVIDSIVPANRIVLSFAAGKTHPFLVPVLVSGWQCRSNWQD